MTSRLPELPGHVLARIIESIPNRNPEKAVAMAALSKSIRREFPDHVRHSAAQNQTIKAWKKTWLSLFKLLKETRLPLAIKLPPGLTLSVTATDRDLYTRILNPDTTYLKVEFTRGRLDFYRALSQKDVKKRPGVELVNAKKHILVTIKWPPKQPDHAPKYRGYRITFSDVAEALIQYQDPGYEFELLDPAGIINQPTKDTITSVLDRLRKHAIDMVMIGTAELQGGATSCRQPKAAKKK